MEETMMKEEFVPEDSAPVPMNGNQNKQLYILQQWNTYLSYQFNFVKHMLPTVPHLAVL